MHLLLFIINILVFNRDYLEFKTYWSYIIFVSQNVVREPFIKV